MSTRGGKKERWPDLPLARWQPTRDTLHMWTQIAGKTLLALAPVQNHWWHAALRVSPRGLAAPTMVDGDRTLDLEFDLIDHVLTLRTSEGRSSAMPLVPRTVRSFHEEYTTLLRTLGVDVHLWTMPVEVTDPIPFDRDEVHREYDAAWAHRFWEVLRRTDAALKAFAGAWVGKQSPVHFFWGSFDLAATRFSGRRAPDRPGADRVTREAYSHEVISVGFWPGGTTPGGAFVGEAVFYGYAAPEPEGFRGANVRPEAARYHPGLAEFLLPYEAVRTAPDPESQVRQFCASVYEAGATLGGWDRASLERVPQRREGAGADEHPAVQPAGP